jgi:type II secretory pathway pseudopilin PulG
MLTVSFSVALVCLGVTAAVGLPLLGRHLVDRQQREREQEAELLRQREVIADYEATIHAYRQFVKSDPELSLTAR